jgi:hypothetical protein
MKRGELPGGRIVRAVIPRLGGGEPAIQHFNVAIDDDDAALAAVRKLAKFTIDVSVEVVGELRPGFIAVQSMYSGDVRVW